MTYLGFSTDDIQLVLDLYDGASFAISLPSGTSADIPLRVGLRQGCALSCLLSNIVIHALIRYLRGTGHTFQHSAHTDAHPLEEGPAAFADDLAILFASPDHQCFAQMQDLLARLEQFCDWAGIAVSVVKTEACPRFC